VKQDRALHSRSRSVRASLRAALVPLIAGVGLALSIPPWGFWVVAFPAAALLWWQLGNGSPGIRRRLWIGFAAGIGLYGPGLFWATSFNVYGGIVLIVVEALALALACGSAGPRSGRLLALPGAMVLAEWLRDIWPFGGMPLGGIALGQVGGPLAGAARLGGPLLLTGLVWLGGAGLGSLVSAAAQSLRRGGDHLEPEAPRGAAVAGALSIAVVVAFAVGGANAPDGGKGVSALTVASVQGGGARGLSKAQIDPQVVYRAQVQATSQLHRPAPRLVVWPEDVVSLDGQLAGTATETQLSQIAESLKTTLLVGVTETVSASSFRNEIVGFAPSGSIVGTYEKVHRVPFGEYVPLRGLFQHLANLSAVPQDAIPGHGTGFMRTPAAPVGLMVSYEVFFADAGRNATRAGAQLLVVPTNTSSYSTSQVPTQEVAADRLQAIEEGRDLVQTAPTGFSTFVDNRGRVLQRSVLGDRQVLTATLELHDAATVYERFGDLPVLVLAMLGLASGLFVELRRRPQS
jgi:apolipoprotein N-acyltransferase